jgi:hypothetical protein
MDLREALEILVHRQSCSEEKEAKNSHDYLLTEAHAEEKQDAQDVHMQAVPLQSSSAASGDIDWNELETLSIEDPAVMTPTELCARVMALQSQRVLTYKFYDRYVPLSLYEASYSLPQWLTASPGTRARGTLCSSMYAL